MRITRRAIRSSVLSIAIPFLLAPPDFVAQASSNDAVIRGVDAAVTARDENVLAYTVTERYSVFRNDEKDPAAQVVVKTTYRKDEGKSYSIVSESGSALIRRQLIPRILENERELTQPKNRPQAVITSANYNMQVKAEQEIAGRKCLLVEVSPRRPSPYLFSGKLWVDATDQSIVQFEGIAAKSPSVFTGATQVSRTYDRVNGYPMATRATAISNSWLLGRTTVQIDYADYEMSLRTPSGASR